MSSTSARALYWRALRRVSRRVDALRESRADGCGTCIAEDEQLLREAVRTANRLCDLGYGRQRLPEYPEVTSRR